MFAALQPSVVLHHSGKDAFGLLSIPQCCSKSFLTPPLGQSSQRFKSFWFIDGQVCKYFPVELHLTLGREEPQHIVIRNHFMECRDPRWAVWSPFSVWCQPASRAACVEHLEWSATHSRSISGQHERTTRRTMGEDVCIPGEAAAAPEPGT